MTSILKKYNKGKLFTYDSEKERDFVNLKTLFENYGEEEIYTVEALFINTKSRYGDAPVIATDKYLVNCPQHLTDMVREMIADDELVEMVNDDRVGFVIYSYKGKNGNGFSVNWVEL